MKNDATINQKLDELTATVARLTALIEERSDAGDDLIPTPRRASDSVDLSEYADMDPQTAQEKLAAEFERIVLAKRLEMISR